MSNTRDNSKAMTDVDNIDQQRVMLAVHGMKQELLSAIHRFEIALCQDMSAAG